LRRDRTWHIDCNTSLRSAVVTDRSSVVGLAEVLGQPGQRTARNLERKDDLEIEHRRCRSIETPGPARAALERRARRSRVEPRFTAGARSTA